MRKNDIAFIILIAAISAVCAWFAASALIGEPKQADTKYKTAESISGVVDKPDSTIFNKDAINPTVERSIGQTSSQLPFENDSEE